LLDLLHAYNIIEFYFYAKRFGRLINGQGKADFVSK
jgi:hypothetical protein